MSCKSMLWSSAEAMEMWEANRERMRVVRRKSEGRRRREGGGVGRVLVDKGVMRGYFETFRSRRLDVIGNREEES